MHEGHRKRVKELFLSAGLESFHPHNVLELLLFYSISRQDTNEIAHRLLERFGCLSGVLEAPMGELCKVEGIGESSAILIMLVFQLAKRYLKEQALDKLSFDSTAEFRSYVTSLFLGCKSEAAYLLCLNNAGQLLNNGQLMKKGKLLVNRPVSHGTKNAAYLDDRTLLETAFLYNATKVVLAHNHPNGLAAPSSNDIQRTQSAAKLFHSVDIQLLDHLIVAPGECFSMASHPRFSSLFLTKLMHIKGEKAADTT
jgi:DNA repair protein RadC